MTQTCHANTRLHTLRDAAQPVHAHVLELFFFRYVLKLHGKAPMFPSTSAGAPTTLDVWHQLLL